MLNKNKFLCNFNGGEKLALSTSPATYNKDKCATVILHFNSDNQEIMQWVGDCAELESKKKLAPLANFTVEIFENDIKSEVLVLEDCRCISMDFIPLSSVSNEMKLIVQPKKYSLTSVGIEEAQNSQVEKLNGKNKTDSTSNTQSKNYLMSKFTIEDTPQIENYNSETGLKFDPSPVFKNVYSNRFGLLDKDGKWIKVSSISGLEINSLEQAQGYGNCNDTLYLTGAQNKEVLVKTYIYEDRSLFKQIIGLINYQNSMDKDAFNELDFEDIFLTFSIVLWDCNGVKAGRFKLEECKITNLKFSDFDVNKIRPLELEFTISYNYISYE